MASRRPRRSPIKRTEDPRFITGKGRYLDDIKLPRWPTWPSCAAHTPTPTSARSTRRRPRRCPACWRSSSAQTSRTTRCRWPGRPVAAPASRTTSARRGRSPRTASSGPAKASPRSSPRRRRRRTTRSRRSRSTGSRCPAVVDAEKAIPAGRPATPRERPEQRGLRVERRRQGRHGRRDRRRRGRGPPADRQPAAHPQPDGDPRRHRLVQPGHGRVHDLDVQPDAAHPAAAAGRLRDGHPGAQDPLHQPGRRRRIRHEDLLLCGHGAGPVRQQGARRPAGQVGRGPARELPEHDPRPRPHHLPRDRRQARRRGHRAPGQDPGQPRRPPVDDRPRHPDDPLRPRAVAAATRSPTSTPR